MARRKLTAGIGYVVTWQDAYTDGGSWKTWEEALASTPLFNDSSGIYLGRTKYGEIVLAALCSSKGWKGKVSNLVYIPEGWIQSVSEIKLKTLKTKKRKRK